jgi:GMP synthase-like glutamine amidotransferase
MKLHWFQHVPFEGLGSIEHWANRRGYGVRSIRAHQQDPWPVMEEVDWLIVMGGPMNIYEEKKYPWLAGEKQFIGNAIAAGKTVIGICLGAQLIADVLGSKVYAGQEKEIGWFPVLKTKEAAKSKVFRDFPSDVKAFHWHGDTFDLPPGSIRIAESAGCPNQAYIYEDRVLGLQFHLEITKQGAEDLVWNCRDELVEGPFIQSAEYILGSEEHFMKVNKIMEQLLDTLADAYAGNNTFFASDLHQ